DAVRQHGGHPLAHEADDVVEDVGVVRIYQMIFVSGRAVEPARDILPGVDGDHTRYGQGLLAPDADDARVRVRGTQDLQMQDIGHGDVQGVASAAGDDRLGEGVLEARSTSLARDVFLGLGATVDGIVDGAVARAA